MAGIEKKLASFSNLILSEAKEQQAKIMEEVNRQKSKIMQDKEMEFLTEAYEDIQKIVAKCEKNGNEQVLKIETELKKNLIKKREHWPLVDKVFERVLDQINEFQNTPAYQAWLVALSKKAIAEIGGENCQVHLSKKDAAYQAALEQEIPGIQVIIENSDALLGGVTVENVEKHIFDDFSIASMLEHQRQEFLKISGLSIR